MPHCLGILIRVQKKNVLLNLWRHIYKSRKNFNIYHLLMFSQKVDTFSTFCNGLFFPCPTHLKEINLGYSKDIIFPTHLNGSEDGYITNYTFEDNASISCKKIKGILHYFLRSVNNSSTSRVCPFRLYFHRMHLQRYQISCY